MYRIRDVDLDDEIESDLALLHDLAFEDSARRPDFSEGEWWIAYLHAGGIEPQPIGFAGLVPSMFGPRVGYLSRVGVVPEHRGHGLQRRLMSAAESYVRRTGGDRIVSDTTDNVPSANNFIRAGYRLFEPQAPWAFAHSLYWTKGIR